MEKPRKKLKKYLHKDLLEAGCDEAGRGCLAGPVFAAAVILPKTYYHKMLHDSKTLTLEQRLIVRTDIEKHAIAYQVAQLSHLQIDKYNILYASIRAMHKALNGLKVKPNHILVDGNKFLPYKDIDHSCIIKGDGIYACIAAASVLAKTYRDEYMEKLHHSFPNYGWIKNKGYPTQEHRQAIIEFGPCDHHRRSFRLFPTDIQGSLFDDTFQQ